MNTNSPQNNYVSKLNDAMRSFHASAVSHCEFSFEDLSIQQKSSLTWVYFFSNQNPGFDVEGLFKCKDFETACVPFFFADLLHVLSESVVPSMSMGRFTRLLETSREICESICAPKDLGTLSEVFEGYTSKFANETMAPLCESVISLDSEDISLSGGVVSEA